VYWKPIFNLLEGQFEVILANAQHLKAVPGHKTDIKDAEWIAERYAAWQARALVSFRLHPSATYVN
jgi:transposase